MKVAYAAPAEWRPASMISNAPPGGSAGGETSRHVLPPFSVSCTTAFVVAAQMTPALTLEAEKVVMDAPCAPRGPTTTGTALPGTSVKSGLISRHVTPPSVVRIRNWVPRY